MEASRRFFLGGAFDARKRLPTPEISRNHHCSAGLERSMAQVSLQMPSSSSDSAGQIPHRKANFTKLAEPLSSCGLQFMSGLLGNKRKLAVASSPRCFASSPGRAGTPNVSLADFEIVEPDTLPYTATCGTSFRSWCHSQFGQNYTMPPRSSWFQSYLCKLFAR